MRFLLRFLLFLFFSAASAYAAPINFAGGETGTGPDELTAPNVSMSTTTVKTGTYSYRVHAGVGGSAEMIMQCLSTAGAVVDCSIAGSTFAKTDFNYAVLPSGSDANIEIYYVENVSFSPMGSVNIDSTGHLLVKNNAGTTVATGTTVLSANTWYRLEFQITKGATGAYNILINGNTELTGTANFGTGNARVFWFGEKSNTVSSNPDFFFDNMVVDSAAFPGAVFVHRMAPTGDGTLHQWTSGTSTSDWTQVNEVPTVTTNYEMSNGSATQTTQLTLASAGASGIQGTIAATKTFVSRTLNTTGTTSDEITTFDGVSSSTNTGAVLTTSAATAQQLLTAKPSTGAWTVADLNQTQIGCIEVNAVSARLNAASLMVLSNDISSFNPNRQTLMGVGF